MACDAPLSIRYNPPLEDGKGGHIYSFPADCGKCLKCLTKRKAQWSYRLTEEQRRSFSSYFVTLTYEEANLTFGDNGPVTNKLDHFKFIDQLKELEKSKKLALRSCISEEELNRIRDGIKEEGKLAYYGVSEYGERFGRPHWHYILFNVRDINNIDLAWGLGKVQVDECNVNTIDYVLKYMIKETSPGKYENKTRECSFMSKGLGNVVNTEFINYIQTDSGNMVINSRYQRVPLPRYFRKKYIPGDARTRKNVYIRNMVEEKEKREDESTLARGGNPDQLRQLDKQRRLHQLRTQSKRNLE
ncbi:MAG: replication initiator protein [Microviridae sp.]|nr:MAG: replication initiator protein [Microviridae sp.]